MGILTSALSQLTNNLIDAGVNQLDAFVTREIWEGRTENALRALDDWENKVAQNYDLANRAASGTYSMPGMDLGGGQGRGIIPVSYPGQQNDIVQHFSKLPPLPAEVFKSPEIYNVVSSTYADALANNPANIQREIQSEAQKNRSNLAREMIGEGFKQNQIGFQEGLGAFDNPAGYDLPREERNRRIFDTQSARTKAQYETAEPYKKNAFDRSVQLRQTPTYSQLNKGTGDPSGGPVSSVTVGEIGRFEKILSGNKIYSYEDATTGKRILNQRGIDALNRAGGILSMQKKKNPLLAIKQAMDQEKADYNTLPIEQRLERMGRPRLGIGVQIQPEPSKLPKEEKERRQREASMPMPSGSVEYQRNVAPQQSQLPTPQATQAPVPTEQTQGQALTPAQVNAIDQQAKNSDPIAKQQWREKLKARGIDPSLIPSLR